MEQGKCDYCLYKWRMIDSLHCDCDQLQRVKHIVGEYPQTRYEAGINRLSKYNEDVI